MKRIATVLLGVIAAAVLLTAEPATARRLGGGGSLGIQRQSVAPRPPSAPSGAAAQPVMPAQPGAAAKPAVTPTSAASSGMSRWLGPIAGLAAGLGLAALFAHLGLPEGLGSVLLLALGVLAAVAIARVLFARKPAGAMPSYAGALEPRSAPATYPEPAPAPNPASEPVMPDPMPQVRPLPAGFDAESFAREAKIQFNRLQAAYDAGDRQTMARVMTPEMFAEVSRQLTSRGDHRATEVVSLNAGVLEVTTEGANHWASVRYTGLVREDGEAAPKPIDEVWNLTKPVDGSSGWLLAGIQQTA